MIGLLIAGIGAFVSMVALHNFKWNLVNGKELEPPDTYIWGVGAHLLIYSAWYFFVRPDWILAIAGIWGIFISGGIAVKLCYFLERHPSTNLVKTSVGRTDARSRERKDPRTD